MNHHHAVIIGEINLGILSGEDGGKWGILEHVLYFHRSIKHVWA